MLEFKDVCFNYGNGVPVLEHINIRIGPGEFIGLGGRNGCGKTTVTRLLMGLEKPVSGEILHDGKVINDDDASARSHYIGYVFQRPERQMFRSTVEDEVAYGPQQLGMSRPESVALSMAVPGMKYCRSMQEFTEEMLRRIGGNR